MLWLVLGLTAATILLTVTLAGGGEQAATPTTIPTGSVGAGTPGDLAPDFTVPLADGGTFTLSRHLAEDGRPIFLNLWASWCFPCREEMPALSAAAERHPDVLFLGVAVQDDPVSARSFAEEIGVSYPIAFDEGDVVDETYRPLGLPATYLIDEEGRIVNRLFGGLTPDQIEGALTDAFGS